MFPRPNLTCPCCGRPMAVTFGQKFLLCSTVFTPIAANDTNKDPVGQIYLCPCCGKALQMPGWVHWLPKIVSLVFPFALQHFLLASAWAETWPFSMDFWVPVLVSLLLAYPVFVLICAAAAAAQITPFHLPPNAALPLTSHGIFP